MRVQIYPFFRVFHPYLGIVTYTECLVTLVGDIMLFTVAVVCKSLLES